MNRICKGLFIHLCLLLDLVIELSASKRSQARMDIHCCVNVSGVRGGFIFRYCSVITHALKVKLIFASSEICTTSACDGLFGIWDF